MKEAMIEQSRHNEIARAILTMGAIRYVPLSSRDGFFVFKYPGSLLFPYEGKDVNNSYFFAQLIKDNDRSHRFFPATHHSKNFCYIYHNDVLKKRITTSEEALSWNGEIEEYLKNYSKEYNAAPEFLLDTHFTVKAVEKDWSDDFGLCSIMPDYLIPRKDVKISSQPYWKNLTKLLKKVGLLKQNIGKIKSVDPITKKLRAFVLKEFKSIKRMKPLPLKILKTRLEAEVDRLFPDDEKKAEKYHMSESTIRRLVESSTKK